MNVYLAVISKNNRKIQDIESKIDYLMRETLFDYIEPLKSVVYSRNHESAIFLFSIRAETLLDETRGKCFSRYAITSSGYPMEESYHDLLEQNGCDKKCVSKLNGVFSLCVMDRFCGEVRAYNNHMRLENVYYGENEDYYFVGTRALLIHMLITDAPRPRLNTILIPDFLHRGYFPCKGTAFEGVTEIPIYSELRVNNRGIHITPIEDLKDQYFKTDISAQIYDKFTEDLLNAARRIKPLYRHAKIWLTGGKDSRMMILAMQKAGAEVSAETVGLFDDSPDVIVAKRIAEMLDIEHTTINSDVSNDNKIVQDILGRTQRVLFASDCGLYGFEGCAGTWGPYATDYALFSGLGGEVLRGGYAKRLKRFTTKEVVGRVERLYNTVPQFFLPETLQGCKERYYDCFETIPADKPEGMDWVYVQEHMGKWAAAAMRCWGMQRQYLMPLCDEQLIKKALKIKTLNKVDDRLIFEIIKRLDDRFTTLPLADDRWSFEKNGPLPGDEKNYILREPVVAKTKLGAFTWRRQTLTDMRENMASVIFDSSCSQIFDYLNRKEIEKLFGKDNDEYLAAPYNCIFAWSVYTAKIGIPAPSARSLSTTFTH